MSCVRNLPWQATLYYNCITITILCLLLTKTTQSNVPAPVPVTQLHIIHGTISHISNDETSLQSFSGHHADATRMLKKVVMEEKMIE